MELHPVAASIFAAIVFAAGFVIGRSYERQEWRHAAEHGKDGVGIKYASGRAFEVRRHMPGGSNE